MMKTFDDLDFQENGFIVGVVARVFFPNGYGIAVYQDTSLGAFSYGAALLEGNEEDWAIHYINPITLEPSQNYEYTPEQITNLMFEVSLL